jgi:INO80 complex subunit C
VNISIFIKRIGLMAAVCLDFLQGHVQIYGTLQREDLQQPPAIQHPFFNNYLNRSLYVSTMAPATPAKDDEAHQLLLSQLDIAAVPKPFRNSHWKPSQRRNKNVKAIISETTRKEASQLATQTNSGATTPFPATSAGTTDGAASPAEGAGKAPNLAQAARDLSTLVLEKNARAMFPSGPAVTYTNIESAPSLDPSNKRHYCDITGLSGPYTDPKTRLRYHDKEIFGVIRNLSQGVPESYLEARGAHTVLK